MLFLILSLAFGLRVWGLNFGLPNLSRPDEQSVSNAFMLHIFTSFVNGAPSLNPQFFNYPSLFIYLASLCFTVYYGIGSLFGAFSTASDFIQLYLNDWSSFLFIQRVLSALFGVFGVWAVIRLGSALTRSQGFGLCCGLLLAVTYLHVRDSHFGVTDIAATTLATICLWQSITALQNQDQSALSRAAVFAGLAASTKYPLALVTVAPASAFYLLAKVQGAQKSDFFQKTSLVTRELQLLGWFIGTFLLVSPYILLDFSHFWHDFSWQHNTFQSVFEREDIPIGWIRHLIFSLWHGLGPLYFITALIGMFMALRSKNPVHWPLLIFVAVFYAVMGNNKTAFVRYIIPIIPVFCVYTCFALSQFKPWLQHRVAHPVLRRVLISALGLIIAWSSIDHSIRFDWLSAQTDTRLLARNWLMQHLNPGDGIGIGKALSHIDLPLQYNKYFLSPVEDTSTSPHQPGHFMIPEKAEYIQEPTERNEYKINTYNDVNTLRQLGVRYVAINTSPLQIFSGPNIELEALQHNPQLRLVQTFLNTPSGKESPPESAYDWEDAFYTPYSQFDEMARPGPNIFIFQVLPAADSNQKSQ